MGLLIYGIGSLLGLLVMILYHKSRAKLSTYRFKISDLAWILIIMCTSWLGTIMAALTVGTEVTLWEKCK